MLKHVGRIKNNGRKVVVAYRTLPNDAMSTVVVTTENLEAADHDSLMTLVTSNAGQTANEFAEAMSRTLLSDGSNMLARFHKTGKMVKMPTNSIEMLPDTKTVLPLDELNEIIAKQKGISIEDLAIKDSDAADSKVTSVQNSKTTEQSTQNKDEVLSDADLAARLRSQADQLFKEAKNLREQAETLVPTKRKNKKVDEIQA